MAPHSILKEELSKRITGHPPEGEAAVAVTGAW